MNTTRRVFLTSAIVLTSLASAGAMAQVAAATTEGEIRKIDKDNSKVTIRHGEIKAHDMPPMTMSFQVADAKMLDGLKVGDKVGFVVEKRNGALVITALKSGN